MLKVDCRFSSIYIIRREKELLNCLVNIREAWDFGTCYLNLNHNEINSKSIQNWFFKLSKHWQSWIFIVILVIFNWMSPKKNYIYFSVVDIFSPVFIGTYFFYYLATSTCLSNFPTFSTFCQLVFGTLVGLLGGKKSPSQKSLTGLFF